MRSINRRAVEHTLAMLIPERIIPLISLRWVRLTFSRVNSINRFDHQDGRQTYVRATRYSITLTILGFSWGRFFQVPIDTFTTTKDEEIS